MLAKLFRKPTIWEYAVGISTMLLICLTISGEITVNWATSPIWLRVMAILWLVWWIWMLFRLLIIPLGILLSKLPAVTVTPPIDEETNKEGNSKSTIEKGETPSPKCNPIARCKSAKPPKEIGVANEDSKD